MPLTLNGIRFAKMLLWKEVLPYVENPFDDA